MRSVSVNILLGEDQNTVLVRALKKSGLKRRNVSSLVIVKKSVDARIKSQIKFCYTVNLYEGDEPSEKVYEQVGGRSVIVVGAGPAGLSAALNLVRHGVKVKVFERGERVEDRVKTVKTFTDGGQLDPDSNVQFGEGGAGTFSDGKLNTQVNSPEIRRVLRDFVSFGAPEDILYLNKPHVGSDRLPEVVKNMRLEIQRLGGSFYFSETVTGLIVSGSKVRGVVTDKGEYPADGVMLCIGHSSRDTFEYLNRLGVGMENKEFAVGFRIEQLQEIINADRYGDNYKNPMLPVADYKVVSHLTERAVFSFCMCPGGVVVPSASEKNMLVVNGMSNYARDGANANSAVVCQVKRSDFDGSDVMAGVRFQRKIERLAFDAIGGYSAPVQLAEDFIADRKTVKLNGVTPTYSRGYGFFELK
ncbi:MAG: FAD-dependent oxidoreductase, partial [Clostridia bacterium]|nr:FAD-dependent oxidoreductase [Clostridia bacterium]